MLHLNKFLPLGISGGDIESQPAPGDVNGQETSAIEGTGNVFKMNRMRTSTMQQVYHCYQYVAFRSTMFRELSVIACFLDLPRFCLISIMKFPLMALCRPVYKTI